MASEAWGECGCNDNNMHRVAWAQVHSISFPADRNVNFHGQLDRLWEGNWVPKMFLSVIECHAGRKIKFMAVLSL